VERILVRGGCIVSMDDSVGDFPKGDILIEDGVIARVASHIDADDAELIDASDTIVIGRSWITFAAFVRAQRPRSVLKTCTRPSSPVLWKRSTRALPP